MSAVEVFQFPATGQAVRTLLIDGAPWFVGRDACEVLGISKYRDALAQLDTDERVSAAVDTLGGPQQMTVISESGLYSLMFVSRSPKVQPFRRWVTGEVLPTIRRTGGYGVEQRHEIPQTYAQALQLAATQAAEIEQQRTQLAIAQPKAEYVDSFVNAKDDASTVRVFAGQLGVGEQALREYLQKRKVIYRRVAGTRWSRSEQKTVSVYEWLAYAGYRNWFQPVDQPQAPRLHNGQMTTTLYVTPLGKVEIRRLLMKHPMAEEGAA